MPHLQSLGSSSPPTAHAAWPEFNCEWSESGRGAAWVHLTGELDIATAPRLDHTLREAQSRACLVALDLRDLDFIDSAGLHVIVDADLRARRDGGRLVVVRGPGQLDAAFRLTGVCDKLDIIDLDPSEPAVRALVRLAPDGTAA